MIKKKIILVIDDEQDLVDMVGFQLRGRGFEVVTALDGREGLERLKDAKPDLVILDMTMPNMGGIDFFKNICDGQGNPPYPVLLLTARTNMAIWHTLFPNYKVAGLVTKPFEIKQLIAAIDEATGMRENVPHCAGDDAVTAGKDMREQHISLPPEQRKRVIVLENDPIVFRELKTILEGYDCAIHLAATAQECLKAAAEAPVDFIILKHITGDDNLEVFSARLKEIPQLLKTPLIVYDNIGKLLVKEIAGQNHELFVMNEEGQRLLEKVKTLLGSPAPS